MGKIPFETYHNNYGLFQVFKQAARTFKNLNCTDPKFISHSVIGDVFHLGDLSAVANPVFRQKDVQFPFSTSLPYK